MLKNIFEKYNIQKNGIKLLDTKICQCGQIVDKSENCCPYCHTSLKMNKLLHIKRNPVFTRIEVNKKPDLSIKIYMFHPEISSFQIKEELLYDIPLHEINKTIRNAKGFNEMKSNLLSLCKIYGYNVLSKKIMRSIYDTIRKEIPNMTFNYEHFLESFSGGYNLCLYNLYFYQSLVYIFHRYFYFPLFQISHQEIFLKDSDIYYHLYNLLCKNKSIDFLDIKKIEDYFEIEYLNFLFKKTEYIDYNNRFSEKNNEYIKEYINVSKEKQREILFIINKNKDFIKELISPIDLIRLGKTYVYGDLSDFSYNYWNCWHSEIDWNKIDTLSPKYMGEISSRKIMMEKKIPEDTINKIYETANKKPLAALKILVNVLQEKNTIEMEDIYAVKGDNS